jgi:choline transport protein
MAAFSLLNLVVNTVGKRLLPMIQMVSGVLHVLFFFIIMIVLLATSKKASSGFVWTTFQNSGGWSNNGVSFCIGLLLPAFSISGADGCVHMAEEVRNASRNIPKAFVLTLVINGTMAFLIMVVSLYCITDLDAVLNTATGFPIIEIFYQATGSTAAATIMDVMMMVVQVSCSFCLLAAASRLAWSFSREQGFPGSHFLSKVTCPCPLPLLNVDERFQVHPTLKVPTNAVYVSITISILLSVIVIGSTVALDAIVSLCTVSAFMSYLLPIGSFLWYRIYHGDAVQYGQWKLGRFGIPINIFALCWCIFFIVILPFPTILPVTAQDFNYGGPILLAVLAILSVDWVIRGRKHYHGPVIEVTVHESTENGHGVVCEIVQVDDVAQKY